MKTPHLWAAAPLVFFSAAGGIFAQENMAPATEQKAVAPTPTTLPAKGMSRAEEILQRFDKNGDGRLDEDEKADAHETMLEEQAAKDAAAGLLRERGVFEALALELFDRNHDARIDDNERRDAWAFVLPGDRVEREVLLQHFDKNNDGKLDEAERHAAALDADEPRAELMLELLLKRYDANANRQLDAEEKNVIREAWSKQAPGETERAALQQFVLEEGEGVVQEWLRRRFDANGNGRWEPEEEKVGRTYAQEHRGEIAREVLLSRFDANKDGLLDAAERATWRETLKTPSQKNADNESSPPPARQPSIARPNPTPDSGKMTAPPGPEL